MMTAGLLWVALGLVAAFFIGAAVSLADARRPRAGDIGPVRRRVDLEPMPEAEPFPEPAPVPVPERPMEPAR